MTSRAQQLIDAANDALRRRDAKAAKTLLNEAEAELPALQIPWLLLARTSRMLEDPAEEERALRKLLDRDSRDLGALLLMGDLKQNQNNDRAAGSWYMMALNIVTLNGAPPQFGPLIARAQSFLESSGDRYANHLNSCMSALDGPIPERVNSSINLLLGKTQLYQQQPTSFYFPGLPQRQFFERHEFSWIEMLESHTSVIADEVTAMVADDDGFHPYVEDDPDRPAPGNLLRNDPSWGALYLWKYGEMLAGNAAACPKSMAALDAVPLPRIAKRSPIALFSRLKPDTHIQPHHGLLNTRLICHLPLIVPEGCGIRVGNETREWQPGKTLIFDDSFEHEAWNRGKSDRIVLLFEIWRPEITPEERHALTVLFEAINDYGVPIDEG
jgi:aspartyl/asparaginyl beta-hydroxylase (cupin superfamily)